LSVAEADDKPAKYPGIFAESKALLFNRIDLLAGGHVEFDTEQVKAGAGSLSKSLEIFPISAKTGKAAANRYHWLGKSIRKDAPEP